MKSMMNKLIASGVFVFAILGLCAQSALAQQEDVPRVEVGPLFTMFRDTDLNNSEAGFGGRITINPHWLAGVEAEISHYPNVGAAQFLGPHADADVTTGLFGIKLTPLRTERAAVFGKLRPGFAHVRFNIPSLPGGPFRVRDTEFAMDFGGGVELFPVRWFGLRFDVGDLFIRDVEDDRVPLAPGEVIRGSNHNLLFTAGFTLRFGGE
ncbi:MAG: hypothetical protein HY314_07720 [Acidobacteria bacterium]|nr:hypothetical protein [Acidobacteriota bacterium]